MADTFSKGAGENRQNRRNLHSHVVTGIGLNVVGWTFRNWSKTNWSTGVAHPGDSVPVVSLKRHIVDDPLNSSRPGGRMRAYGKNCQHKSYRRSCYWASHQNALCENE